MRRVLIACCIAIGAAVVYWLASPLFITRRVAEELPTVPPRAADVPVPASAPQGSDAPTTSVAAPASAQEPIEIARGMFRGLAGHRAEGTARIIEQAGTRYVRFESDFRITNGPDLFVYLGNNGAYDPNVRLHALKGNEGSQNYALPSGDLSAYDEVWVWCRAFSIPFGMARMAPTAPNR